VECKVRATKATLDADPSVPPVFSEYSIMESSETAKLPDGDYEVLANGEIKKVRRTAGRFVARL
jgi:hypothetical protein